ncbi:MAG: hypothetical protein ACE5JO_10285, partial [Candidatus Binatia bacterium]
EEKMAAAEKKRKEETKEIEEKTRTLAEEVEKSRLERLLPEKAELKSVYGLGPAASSVYQVKRGLSWAAYGEATYRKAIHNIGSKKDQADFLRFVTYLGYKFNDWILLNSEIEWEHGTTSGIGAESGKKAGSVSLEFAYLDFLFHKYVNARAGLLLVPMGFINEIHEPPFFHGVRRPEVDQRIIPTTWREMGFGLFGELGDVQYRTYLMHGLRAKRFDKTKPLRRGRQKGNRALFEDVTWTARLDYTPTPIRGLLLGGSVWLGDSGQNETIGGRKPDAFTTLWEIHGQYRFRRLELRAVGAWGHIADARLLSDGAGSKGPIPERFFGWYVETAYNILPTIRPGTTHYLAPYFRFESFDTQSRVPRGFARDRSKDINLYTVGLSYKPIPNVVLKMDYRNFDTKGPKNVADEWAIALGFAF